MTGLSLAVVALTLVGVAVGRYPRLHMNRATIALVGATLLVLLGALSLEQAFAAIDLNTLALLLAMMILNGNLRLAGFLPLLTSKLITWAKTPRQLLAVVVVSSGVLSAVLLNDTIVLAFTPLVLEVTRSLRRNPLPYLVALVTSANIGSVATVIGNPQNMLIGLSSGIPFLAWCAKLFPVAAVGLLFVWLVVAWVYRREVSSDRFVLVTNPEVRIHRALLWKGLVATGGMVVALALDAPIPLAALGAAAFLLITRRLKAERVFREIDVSLLVFFASLFVVTHALETTGVAPRLFAWARPLAEGGIPAFTGQAALVSNLVSNVPAVLLFKPLVAALPHPESAWLALAMATTLAGNLTLMGSMANLIVAEIARGQRVELGFVEYLKAGVPITLLSLAWGVGWLMWRGT